MDMEMLAKVARSTAIAGEAYDQRDHNRQKIAAQLAELSTEQRQAALEVAKDRIEAVLAEQDITEFDHDQEVGLDCGNEVTARLEVERAHMGYRDGNNVDRYGGYGMQNKKLSLSFTTPTSSEECFIGVSTHPYSDFHEEESVDELAMILDAAETLENLSQMVSEQRERLARTGLQAGEVVVRSIESFD